MMNWMGKRVLVTGAGGFIGSHLSERLVREGCRVKAMVHYDSRDDHSNLEFIEPSVLREMEIIAGDIRDPYFLLNATTGCEIIFHLAALIGIPYSYVAPASYVETNIKGTLNVLEAARINGASRVIHTSTSECYGTAQYTPIDEGHPLRGQSPYAATKIGADKLAESFHLSFGLPVTTVRPFNTFGPRQSARAVIPTILSQLLSGREELRLGELTAIRDLNYVTNTVDGFLAAGSCDKAVGTLLNLGTGVGVTIEELALLAMKVVERNIPIVQDPKRIRPNGSEVFRLLCNFEKVKELTGWTPAIDLEDGLRKTAQYVDAHPNRYRPDEYKV